MYIISSDFITASNNNTASKAYNIHIIIYIYSNLLSIGKHNFYWIHKYTFVILGLFINSICYFILSITFLNRSVWCILLYFFQQEDIYKITIFNIYTKKVDGGRWKYKVVKTKKNKWKNINKVGVKKFITYIKQQQKTLNWELKITKQFHWTLKQLPQKKNSEKHKR